MMWISRSIVSNKISWWDCYEIVHLSNLNTRKEFIHSFTVSYGMLSGLTLRIYFCMKGTQNSINTEIHLASHFKERFIYFMIKKFICRLHKTLKQHIIFPCSLDAYRFSQHFSQIERKIDLNIRVDTHLPQFCAF